MRPGLRERLPLSTWVSFRSPHAMDIDGDSTPFQSFNLTSSVQQQPPPPSTGSIGGGSTGGGPPVSFGLIVPGGPVHTNFVPVDANKLALTLSCPGDIPVPLQSVTEIVLFSATEQLAADQGVLCYWQASIGSASTGFALLGAITASRPSAVLATRWSENEPLIELLSQQHHGTATSPTAFGTSSSTPVVNVTIGLSIEPVASIANIDATALAHHATNDKLFVAQKIAADLFRFMQSFDTGGNNSGSGTMMVPHNIFDRWFQRFENRFRRDPNFFLKQASE
jgi:protein Hikeshi